MLVIQVGTPWAAYPGHANACVIPTGTLSCVLATVWGRHNQALKCMTCTPPCRLGPSQADCQPCTQPVTGRGAILAAAFVTTHLRPRPFDRSLCKHMIVTFQQVPTGRAAAPCPGAPGRGLRQAAPCPPRRWPGPQQTPCCWRPSRAAPHCCSLRPCRPLPPARPQQRPSPARDSATGRPQAASAVCACSAQARTLPQPCFPSCGRRV